MKFIFTHMMEETIAAQVASKEGEVVGQFSCIFETITTKI